MPRKKDYSHLFGSMSGGLLILGISDRKCEKTNKQFLACKCTYCGKFCSYVASDLGRKDVKKRPKSCGCQKILTSIKNLKTVTRNTSGSSELVFAYDDNKGKFIPLDLEHRKKDRLYNIWCDMKKRCYNKKSFGYPWYGKLGIKICPEWLGEFAPFKDWALSNGYAPTLTIERLDTSKDYSPENCTWIPRKEQGRNKKSTIYLTDVNTGYTYTIPELAIKTNMKRSSLYRNFYQNKKKVLVLNGHIYENRKEV